MTGRHVVNDTSDDTSLAVRVGQRLRQLRQDRGLTLAALSSQSGVSVSYLSAVENGVNHPSLQTLAAITDALGVRIPAVLAEEGQPHVHRSRVPGQAPANVEVSHPLLQLRSRLVVATPGDSGGCPVPMKARDVFVYVIKGQVRLQVGGDTYTLGEGDAMDATNPGAVSWTAIGHCTALWTSCPTRVT